MGKKLRTSRHGLTECGDCGRHVKEAVCPFCGTAERREARRPSGRSAALMAGLMTFSVACDPEEPEPDPVDVAIEADDGTSDASPDFMPQPLYGIAPIDSGIIEDMSVPPDEGASVEDMGPPTPDMQPDFAPQPPYGIPPVEDMGTPLEPDVSIAPLYGLPAGDFGVEPVTDAAPGPDIAMAVPLYGIPPVPKPEPVDMGIEVNDSAGLVLLYGIPPAPK